LSFKAQSYSTSPFTVQRGRDFFVNTRLATTTATSDTSSSEAVIQKLAQKSRTWQRLRHFVELSHTLEATSVADIGCDHGLLSFGLAASGIYSRVLGIDVSMQALENALDNQHRVYKHSSSSHMNCTLEFQLGNGLETVKDSTLDVVCVAGMGVHTMTDILSKPALDRVNCNHVMVQPTNSRPLHMVTLYDSLNASGFGLMDERIVYLASRWYITSLFEKCRNSDIHLRDFPGDKLNLMKPQSEMGYAYKLYVQHHINWINQIEKSSEGIIINEQVKRWMEAVIPADDQ